MPAPGRLLVFAPFSQNVVIIAWARDFEQRAKQCSERASTLEIVPQGEHEGRQVG